MNTSVLNDNKASATANNVIGGSRKGDEEREGRIRVTRVLRAKRRTRLALDIRTEIGGNRDTGVRLGRVPT